MWTPRLWQENITLKQRVIIIRNAPQLCCLSYVTNSLSHFELITAHLEICHGSKICYFDYPSH